MSQGWESNPKSDSGLDSRLRVGSWFTIGVSGRDQSGLGSRVNSWTGVGVRSRSGVRIVVKSQVSGPGLESGLEVRLGLRSRVSFSVRVRIGIGSR
ncbi:hypothetical protein HAX54_049311, partial [Datura stramonium]|nr:hypothetical protein [Datura stramonium]